MIPVPSRWNDLVGKDIYHFYFFIVGGTLLAISTYFNIFVGPPK